MVTTSKSKEPTINATNFRMIYLMGELGEFAMMQGGVRDGKRS
jgi:hypothetical protein